MALATRRFKSGIAECGVHPIFMHETSFNTTPLCKTRLNIPILPFRSLCSTSTYHLVLEILSGCPRTTMKVVFHSPVKPVLRFPLAPKRGYLLQIATSKFPSSRVLCRIRACSILPIASYLTHLWNSVAGTPGSKEGIAF